MADIKKLQQDGEEFSPVTHEAAVLNDNNESIAVSYQTTEDDNLNTDDKSIVGAINEVSACGIYMNNLSDVIEPGDPNNPILVRIEELEDTLVEYIENLINNSPNRIAIRETLYNMMIEDGYDEATNSMTIDELISLLDDSQIEIGDIKQIVCANSHVFILKNDGSLWSCGYNDDGELGLGDNVTKTTFTQVTGMNDIKQIACGYTHTVILKNDGTVWSCGYNYYGQLGLGDNATYNTFTQVTTSISDVKQIACGGNQTFIIKNDGSLWACGYNGYGQLGFGDTTKRNVFTQVTTNVNNDIKQIVCGKHQTFIIKNDGSVWSCGYNYYGQLGLSDTEKRTSFTQVTGMNDVKQIVCGYEHTYIIKNDGSLWSCGHNNYGQLGLGDTDDRTSFMQVTTNINNVKQIACGFEHTFIIKNNGSLWSCGHNNYGELGLGDADKRTTFTQVTTNINNDVKQVACSGCYTFIIKNDSSVYSCGYNDCGQLGLGDYTNRNVFTQVPSFPPSSQIIDDNEMNRLKLYYYLLDNSISVTEDMDINTMLGLLINIEGGEDTALRDSLASILEDEGIEVTEEDDMASLISKVDEEFNRKNANSGLDIISATELPATGKENQICVITNNPVNDYVISPLNSDETDSTAIFGQLTNLESPSTVTVNSGSITQKYCFLKFSQGTNVLVSYIYKNGQWVQLTKEMLYLIRDCVHVTDTTAGGLYFNSTSAYYPNMTSYDGMRMHSATSTGKTWITTYNKVNLNNFDTVKIRIANTFKYGNVKISIFRSDARYHNYGSSNPTYYSTLVTTTLTTSTDEYYDYDLDISTWTGEYYLGIMLTGSNDGTDCYVSDFYLYNKE